MIKGKVDNIPFELSGAVMVVSDKDSSQAFASLVDIILEDIKQEPLTDEIDVAIMRRLVAMDGFEIELEKDLPDPNHRTKGKGIYGRPIY